MHAGDAQLRQTRWAQVAAVLLLQQPFSSEAVLQALALTSEERQYTVARLHAKDLASQADELLLKHLLLRAEELPTEHLLQVGTGAGHMLLQLCVYCCWCVLQPCQLFFTAHCWLATGPVCSQGAIEPHDGASCA